MGIDSRSLRSYGGFDQMIQNVLSVSMLSGSAHQDFATAVTYGIEDPPSLDRLARDRGKGDQVAEEIKAALALLNEQQKAELRTQILEARLAYEERFSK